MFRCSAFSNPKTYIYIYLFVFFKMVIKKKALVRVYEKVGTGGTSGTTQ